MSLVSIIIRSKNEEKWIFHCLNMVFSQTFKNIEVIIVDNASVDNTIEIAKRFPVYKIINIDTFKPGLAINQGIRESNGDFIVCLSAHCIPKDNNWLENLLANFNNDDKIAGVYGRQLPVSFTEPIDKRDLLLVFGQDKRVQYKDYFFHNANSMFTRKIWEKFPFNEEVTNIEDRVWGKEVISEGYHIIYEPEASVFHHHGLHQGNELKRAKGVVSIIEKTDNDTINNIPNSFKPDNFNIAAILPIKEKFSEDSNEFKLIKKTINELKNAKYIKNIYILSETNYLSLKLGLLWKIINSSFIIDLQIKISSLDNNVK